MDSALIALLASVITIFLTNALSLLSDQVRRRQKRKDFVLALHAEITASLRDIALQTKQEEQAYSKADPDPFAVADETDFVFEAIREDLTLLPQQVIHSVVAYYKLAMQTNLLTTALRDPQFVRQPSSSKTKYIESLLGLMEEQRRVGTFARETLERHGRKLGLDLQQERESLHRALARDVRRSDE